MGENDGKKKKKVLYGNIAENFREAILADEVSRLARPKKDEPAKPEVPALISDPQGMIIRGRLKRFRPTIDSYCKNFCLDRITRDDFLLAIRNECRKMFNGIRTLGRIHITPTQVNEYAQGIMYAIARMLQGVPDSAVEINMVPPLLDAVMQMVEQAFAERSAMSMHDKIDEGRPDPQKPRDDDPLKDFPESIRTAIVNRMIEMGLNPRDVVTLKRLIRQLGMEPDEAFEELKAGRIPDKLKKYL
jgi:hypothetical protein